MARHQARNARRAASTTANLIGLTWLSVAEGDEEDEKARAGRPNNEEGKGKAARTELKAVEKVYEGAPETGGQAGSKQISRKRTGSRRRLTVVCTRQEIVIKMIKQ